MSALTENCPSLAIEHWPVERLVPSARNARTHSDAQVAEIAGSIHAFGFVNPILAAPDGEVVAGHGRLAAARTLGLTSVPVIVLANLSETQRRQLMLADNRIAENAGWDLDRLRLELRDLADLGADLKTLGFSKAELAQALSGDVAKGLVDEDETPDVSEHAVARPGEIWGLGSHRLACGDSTDPALVAALLDGAVPRLMVTDPPYGVSYDPTWRHRAGVNVSKRRGKVLNDDQPDWSAAWALFPGDIAYVWHGALHATTVAESLISNRFAIRAQIIWAKSRLVIGRGDYHWMHEPCWYAVRNKGHWTGDRKQTTLWTIPTKDPASKEQDTATVHGTQKPVEAMRRPMQNNSERGEAVYEPFMGSGTTLIAAESIGRVCYGVELNPVYVDVAIRRWQAFTGQTATLLRAGPDELGAEERLNAGLSRDPMPSEPDGIGTAEANGDVSPGDPSHGDTAGEEKSGSAQVESGAGVTADSGSGGESATVGQSFDDLARPRQPPTSEPEAA